MPYYLHSTVTNFTSSEGLKERLALGQLARLRKAEPDKGWQVVYRPSSRRPGLVFGKQVK